MRIGTLITDSGPAVVAEVDGDHRPLSRLGLRDLLLGGVDWRELMTGAGEAVTGCLAAPVAPGKVVAIGLNYIQHIEESGRPKPERPLIFAKFPSSVVGPDEPIVVDRKVTDRADWEVELAVVVGRRMKAVSPSDALDHVFGYTVGNDVSARDVQFADDQWVRGKSLDTFCPVGPMIVTPDELPDPQALHLTTRINGEVMQDASTSEMIFTVAELLSFCSHSFTLEPGDVLLTGTPWGVGEFMDPVRSLQPGDVVEVEVEGIGVLRNPVVDAAAHVGDGDG